MTSTPRLCGFSFFLLLSCAPLSVDVTVFGPGRVVIGESDCDADCSVSFRRGTEAKAFPAEGSVFLGWSGLCAGTGTCVPAKTGLLTATFAEAPAVRVKVTGKGSVVRDDGEVCRTECIWAAGPWVLTPRPDVGALFLGFEGDCRGTGACFLESGVITARFDDPAQLAINITGTGSGSVVDSLGLVNCGASCSLAGQVGQEVELSLRPGNRTLTATFEAPCQGQFCRVRLPNTVTARFTKGRHVELRVSGAGSGSIVTDAGIACRTSSCELLVDPASPLAFSAVPDALSSFRAWAGSCAGTAAECLLSASDVDVVNEAKFEGLVALQRRFKIEGAGLPVSNNSVVTRVAADGGLFIAMKAIPGVDIDGQFFGTAMAGSSTTFVRLEDDGGIGWATSIAEYTDAGHSALSPAQLVEVNGRLVAAGYCAGSVVGCGSSGPSLALFELGATDGVLRATVPVAIPGPQVLPSRLPEMGGPYFAMRRSFFDVSPLLNSTQAFDAPFTFYGCFPTNEGLACAVAWASAWTWGGCSARQPAGLANAGVLTLNPTTQRCSGLTEFVSSDPQGVAFPESYVQTEDGPVYWGMFQGAFSVRPGVSTPSGATTFAFLRDGPRPTVRSWPDLNVSSPRALSMTRGIGVFAFNPGGSQVMVFGQALLPNQASLTRFDRELNVASVLLFENVADYAVDSRNGKTAVAVRGVDVRFAGMALAPDGSNYFHVLLLNE